MQTMHMHSSRGAVATLILAAIVAQSLAPSGRGAQTITVEERAIIDFGASGTTLTEPCISATPARRFAVCNSVTSLRAITQGNQSSTWRAGSSPTLVFPDVCVPPGGGCGTPFSSILKWVDPSCANIRLNGEASDTFVALVETAERVAFARYSPSLGFSIWSTIANPSTADSLADVDKLWIVSGGDDELYAVFMQTAVGPKYVFGRSTNGGLSWTFVPITVSGTLQSPLFCAQPVVIDDGGCYLTITGTGPLGNRIVRYSDSTGEFTFLCDAAGTPIIIPQSATALEGDLSGGFRSTPVPWIVGDASETGGLISLFVIRPDVATTGADVGDVNLYCRRVQNSGPDGAWVITATWQFGAVGGDVPDINGHYPDQFCHAAVIDGAGRLNVVYYDNASTSGSGEPLSSNYDAWHILVPSPSTAPPLAPLYGGYQSQDRACYAGSAAPIFGCASSAEPEGVFRDRCIL